MLPLLLPSLQSAFSVTLAIHSSGIHVLLWMDHHLENFQMHLGFNENRREKERKDRISRISSYARLNLITFSSKWVENSLSELLKLILMWLVWNWFCVKNFNLKKILFGFVFLYAIWDFFLISHQLHFQTSNMVLKWLRNSPRNP